MASSSKNQSQAQHLASLDFDISGIIESLQKVDELTKSSAVQAGKNFSESFKSGMDSIQQSTTINKNIVDNSSIEKAKESINGLSSAYGKLAKEEQTLNKNRELKSSTKIFVDENDIRTVVQYNSELEETGFKISKNHEKQQAAQKKNEAQLDSLIQKLNSLKNARELASVQLTSESALKDNRELISQIDEVINKLKSGAITAEQAKKEIFNFAEQSDYIKFDESSYKSQESVLESLNKLLTNREFQGIKLTSESALSDNDKLITQIKELGDSLKNGSITIEQAKKKLEEFAEQSNNIKFNEESYRKEQAALKEQQALKDSFYKKNKSQFDVEIEERERQAKVFSAQIKARLEDQVKQENGLKKISAQVESLIQKQTKLNTVIESQKSSETNNRVLSDNKQLISDLESFNKKVKDGSVTLESAKEQLSNYTSKATELGTEYEKTGAKGESFLKKISDKAKWLGAFYIVNELRQALVSVFSTIKETEDAVVSLQRVLNDDSITNSAIQEELYAIATQYGRTFEEVSSVAQQFVQAGNDWQDSVELTRGTMLALNTAELDVTQSTEGLIAIMAQWNLEAEDYADVIDKINITADNFSVTSEKIVSALQRSSSSAKNANISLEETIGIITALAEATGRSGENIGTALNSLIVYTSKSSALETFAEVGSDAMKKVVQDYQQGAVSIYEVWKQLSKEVSNLSAQQQQILFESADYQELAATLETELKDVYGAAGTYRQNYFIALLNDLSTAEEAVKGMAGAEGYSLQENERYMESLTASLNQLKASVAELSVQFGEAGILEFTKFLVNLATSTLKLTKNLGGLNTVLGFIGGSILLIKSTSFSNSIVSFTNSIKDSISAAKKLSSSLNDVANAQDKISASGKVLQAGFSWIGIALVALTSLYSIIKGTNAAIEEMNRKAIENSAASLEEANSLKELKSEYESIVNYTGDASEKTKELEEYKKKLIEQYGIETEAVKNLTGARIEEVEFLNKEIEANLNNSWVQISSQYEKAAKEIENSGTKIDMSSLFYIDEKSLGVLEEYFDVVKTVDLYGKQQIVSVDFRTENLYEQRDLLAEILTNSKLNSDVSSALQYAYSQITKEIEKWDEAYQQGNEVAQQLFFNSENTLTLLDKMYNAETDSDRKSAYEELIASAKEQNFSLEAQNSIIEQITSSYKELFNIAKDTGDIISGTFSVSDEEMEGFKEGIESLNEEVDSFQSGFDTIISAMQEYNENGYLTIDTIQAIISAGGEYLSMLQFTADGISLNEEKVREFINTQSNNVDALLASAYASDVLRISEKYLGESLADTGVQADNAILKISGLNPELAKLIQNAWNGGDAVFHLAESLAAVAGTTVSGVDMKAYQAELDQARQNWKSIGDEIKSSFGNASTWSNTAASAAKSSSQSQTNALKEQLEAQKEAIKDRYDAEIEALKKVEEENDRIRKKEEYYRNRQEALQDIEKASTRSGVEYREQEEEARQKLEELDREWRETVEDWSIEDQIETLEKMRDAEIAAIDAQIDSIKSGVGSVTNEIAKSSSNLNKTMLDSYKSDYLEPQVELTQKTADTLLQVYEQGFISPLKSSLVNVQQQLANIGVSVPIPPYSPYLHDRLQYQSSVNTTNNQTANVFANIQGQGSANALMNRIFRKP